MIEHQYPLNYVFSRGASRQEISFKVSFFRGGDGSVEDVGVNGAEVL